MLNINLDQFIKTHVLQREHSMFAADIEMNKDQLVRAVKNKRVLVIGGAGTIGSSYIRAVLKFEPSSLVVIDTNENGLTELTRDLRSRKGQYIPVDYRPYPINFGSSIFYKLLGEEARFDIIANFAAHKHVRSEKDAYSIEAMIENNVFHASEFLKALSADPPDHFFCVSTDKAANPVNVMGASKKLMEQVIMAYSDRMKICTARFANVAFSNGSLLDGYIHRMMKNQPLACPSDITRFFVSQEESGQICMLASILGKSGDIFFPKLEATDLEYFKNITEKFITHLGLTVDVCLTENEAKEKASRLDSGSSSYPVFYFETDTAGEKLYEEFYTEKDVIDNDTYTALGVIKNADCLSLDEIQSILRELKYVLSKEGYTKEDIILVLSKLMSDFDHIETGKGLDQKM